MASGSEDPAVLRVEDEVRYQNPKHARGRNRARRGGACRGLGFTSPHGEAGSELRPPVALGAESHLRPWSKPKVIFNQRRSPKPPAPTPSRTAGSQRNHGNKPTCRRKRKSGAGASPYMGRASSGAADTHVHTELGGGGAPTQPITGSLIYSWRSAIGAGQLRSRDPWRLIKTPSRAVSLFFFVKTREWFVRGCRRWAWAAMGRGPGCCARAPLWSPAWAPEAAVHARTALTDWFLFLFLANGG